MYWIETGSVSTEDLSGGVEEQLLSHDEATTVVVFEPGLDLLFVRRFIKKEFKEGFLVNAATNTDRRLLSWTDNAKAEATQVLGFWGNGGLSDLAEEITKMGYERVFFLVLADGGSRLIYETYCTYPDYLEMD